MYVFVRMVKIWASIVSCSLTILAPIRSGPPDTQESTHASVVDAVIQAGMRSCVIRVKCYGLHRSIPYCHLSLWFCAHLYSYFFRAIYWRRNIRSGLLWAGQNFRTFRSRPYWLIITQIAKSTPFSDCYEYIGLYEHNSYWKHCNDNNKLLKLTLQWCL